MTIQPNVHLRKMLQVALAVALIASVAGWSKTRWSATHLVPDADMLRSGELVGGFEGYLTKDTADALLFRPGGVAHFGITEWVNLEVGYAGGPTLGFKARLLGETRKFMPSLAIGAYNFFAHKEANYFAAANAESYANEIFLVVGKSVDAIKTRFHVGIQSIPSKATERANPFFAVEKYFGYDIYATLEGHMRDQQFNVSLFATWRALKDHLEIAAGAVAMQDMFMGPDNSFEVSLAPTTAQSFVKPGIWLGLRYRGQFGIGRKGGFVAIEDRLTQQESTMTAMKREIDSLRRKVDTTQSSIAATNQSITVLSDSLAESGGKLKTLIMDRLITIKSLYESEPFDADRVQQIMHEVVSFREQAVPVLSAIIEDKNIERAVRLYAIQISGDIGNKSASDVLIDALSRTNDPDVKVEILIALGKMKETRTMYLMEQLANDPNDAVALTAQEVLMRLVDETGARYSEGFSPRVVQMASEDTIPERKLLPATAPKAMQPLSKAAPADTGKKADSAAAPVRTADTASHDSLSKDSAASVKSVPALKDASSMSADTSNGSKPSIAPADAKPAPKQADSKERGKKTDRKERHADKKDRSVSKEKADPGTANKAKPKDAW
jgi:hypothetical protein